MDAPEDTFAVKDVAIFVLSLTAFSRDVGAAQDETHGLEPT